MPVAATIYEGIETAHSPPKFPEVEDDEREVNSPLECQLLKDSNRLEYLNAVDVILWDEFTSCGREVFEAAYRALNGFEGNVVITVGDLRQIAPVVVNSCKEDVINHSSPLWRLLTKKTLSKNMRLLNLQRTIRPESTTEEQLVVQKQRELGDIILAIGNGAHLPSGIHYDYVRYPSTGTATVELPGCQRILDIQDVISFVFPSPFQPDRLFNRAILAGPDDD